MQTFNTFEAGNISITITLLSMIMTVQVATILVAMAPKILELETW